METINPSNERSIREEYSRLASRFLMSESQLPSSDQDSMAQGIIVIILVLLVYFLVIVAIYLRYSHILQLRGKLTPRYTIQEQSLGIGKRYTHFLFYEDLLNE